MFTKIVNHFHCNVCWINKSAVIYPCFYILNVGTSILIISRGYQGNSDSTVMIGIVDFWCLRPQYSVFSKFSSRIRVKPCIICVEQKKKSYANFPSFQFAFPSVFLKVDFLCFFIPFTRFTNAGGAINCFRRWYTYIPICDVWSK